MQSIPEYLNVTIVDSQISFPTHCCSCLAFLTYPYRLSPCNHVVCGACSLKYFDNCPQCKQIIITVDLDRNLQNKVLELNVMCACKKPFTVSDYLAHMVTCAEAMILCPNGCGEIFTLAVRDEHLSNVCKFRMVSCKHCGAIVSQNDLDGHVESCQQVQVSCSRCGEQFNRIDQVRHDDICPEQLTPCPLCSEELLRKNKQKHLDEIQLLGRHLVSLHFAVITNTKQIQQQMHELTTKVTKLEQKVEKQVSRPPSQQNLAALEKPVNAGQEKHVIRTSLRFVPNVQDIGTDRINGIQLLMPDVMVANNKYLITTIPPTQRCTLFVEDLQRGESKEIKPVVSRNCVTFPVQLLFGPARFILRNGDQVLDEAQVDIAPQLFMRCQMTIGVYNERVVSHNLLQGSPTRQWLDISSQNSQIFILKIKRVNILLAIGTAQTTRKLQKFWMLGHHGVQYINNGSLSVEYSPIRFSSGDALEICIESDILRISKIGHPEFIEHALDGGVFIEAADAEAVLQ